MDVWTTLRWAVATVVLVPLAGVVTYGALDAWHRPRAPAVQVAPPPAEEVGPRQAAWACRLFAARTLHDPERARWDDPWWSPAGESPGQWAVRLRLRAPNGFGAMRLTTMDCTVELDDGRWHLVWLAEAPD